MKKALIIKTRNGKKGYVYYEDNDSLKSEKLQVKIIDENFKETGENILCSPANLTAIGYKD